MKQNFSRMLLLSLVCGTTATVHATADSCDLDITSRSYLSIHPQFNAALPEKISAFRAERSHARNEGWHGAFQFVLFGSKSTHSENQTRYFFPFGKTSLVIGEDFRDLPGGVHPDVDIWSPNFNLFTAAGSAQENAVGYKSRITIEPKQSTVGVGLHYRQSFWRNEEKGRGLFIDIASPIVHIKN
jgi:hypothetical protein